MSKEKKKIKKLQAERDEFHRRLQEIHFWNLDVLGKQSSSLSAQLREMIHNERREFGFQI